MVSKLSKKRLMVLRILWVFSGLPIVIPFLALKGVDY
jgi:hypothetical protein